MNLNKSKILVIGGAGFIGSFVVSELAPDSLIICMDFSDSIFEAALFPILFVPFSYLATSRLNS